MKKRSLLCLTTMAILAASLAACAGDAPAAPIEETQAGTAAHPVETEDAGPQDFFYTAEFPTQDFGGAEFRIYTSNNINGMLYPTTLNYGAEETGEVVNDALFARDRWLEESFNVKTVYTSDETTAAAGMAGKLSKIILAGDDTYDLIVQDIAQVAYGLASRNCIYPLNSIDTIRLEQPYWMPELNEAMKIAGGLYYSASALSPRFYGSVYVIQFNRDVARALDLEDLYAAVEAGSWTWDKLKTLSRLAIADLNGDGKMDENDRFGMIYEILTPESVVLGMGRHYVQNVNGTLKSMLDDPSLVTILQDMAAFFAEPCVAYDVNRGKVDCEALLQNGNYLFRNPCTFDLAAYRDLPYDYGILPMPKEDEAQKEYYAYSQPWATACPVVPVTLTGDALSRAGVLIDAMAAYGYDYVRPAVFENVIQLKGARDERSGQIIDMIFNNVTFELTSIFKFGELDSTLAAFFTTKLGKMDITSAYAKIESKTQKSIDDVIEQFAEHQKALGF